MNPQALVSFKKCICPSSSLHQGKHLPFSPSPLRLNIFRLLTRSGEGEKPSNCRCLPWSKEEEGAYIFWMKQVPVNEPMGYTPISCHWNSQNNDAVKVRSGHVFAKFRSNVKKNLFFAFDFRSKSAFSLKMKFNSTSLMFYICGTTYQIRLLNQI